MCTHDEVIYTVMCPHDEVMCSHGEVIYVTIERDEVICMVESKNTLPAA